MSTTPTNLAISGLASGFDWQSLVTQLIQVERAPETTMRNTQATLQQKNNAYGSIATQLGTLQNSLNTLKDPSLFDSRQAVSSDSTITTASAATGAPAGSYVFNISQLASNAAQLGGVDSARPISATNDVAGLVLSSAPLGTAITAGTFSVNGATITIAATDTLQSVFTQINSATGGAVTGSYDATTDKISLTSASPIVLGTATDTSNFLQATKLFNNGTGIIASGSALGNVNLGGVMNGANFTTAITDGGAGAGAFSINGVQINFNAATDSVNDVLNRINSSAAGVTASYDSISDRFVLTNKNAGDIGIAMQDITGNFLAATQLSTGTLQRGNNLQYTINNGPTITSQTNTITQSTSGVTGLTVTALDTGRVTVTVSSDTAKIKAAITNFVTQYNAAQKYIDSQTASTTDAQGKVTAGTLTGDLDANNMETQLRRMAGSQPAGLTGAFSTLNGLGIVTNGNDNTISLADTTQLDTALANNLDSVKALFADTTSGLATTMSTYLDTLIGDNGFIGTKQANLTKQSADIDTSIAAMERRITDDQTRLTNEFVAMETAQAKIKQQATYLTQFGSTSTTG